MILIFGFIFGLLTGSFLPVLLNYTKTLNLVLSKRLERFAENDKGAKQ